MAKRSRKRQSSTALLRNGLRYFKKGNYSQAIETWERVAQQTPDMTPTSALAQAYFRRGLKRLYDQESAHPQGGLSDLRRAVELRADDPCYTYHLGLALHRQGEVDQAIRAYRAVRQNGGEFADRVAYPLAVALLQCGEDPTDDSVWSALTEEERAMLSQVGTFRRRPYTLSPDAPLLWRGLAALDVGEHEEALSAFNRILENEDSTNPMEQRLIHYYLGVLAAQREDWDTARHEWNTAHAAGLTLPRLTENLGEAYHRLAEERLMDGDVEGALAAAQEARRHKPDSNSLQELISQTNQRLAYQAASAGRWDVAHEHWEKADAAEGGSFRLAYNLALAHEKAEEFVAAAEKWREALRRRPRSDDHPDAIDDEQVAMLWRRAAEAYTKAGEYDEAVNVYRTAVKYNPDNAETRMDLAEALLINGQIQAAENELNRILERDPESVQALLRLGEVTAARGRWWRDDPIFYWKRVLKIEPDNLTARQYLSDFYLDRAEAALSWNNYSVAVEMYRQALEYKPESAQILAALGGCYIRTGDTDEARSYIEKALAQAPRDLDVYGEIIRAWFDADEPERAWEALEKAEAAVETIPFEFYVNQASYFINEYPIQDVRPWLERAVEKAPPEAPVLTIIGEMATSMGAVEIAHEYLERAIEARQSSGQAHLLLGLLAAREDDLRTASKHWRKAERIARHEQDRELSERVEFARFLFTAPPDLVSRLLREPFGPDFFDDDYDDYYDF